MNLAFCKGQSGCGSDDTLVGGQDWGCLPSTLSDLDKSRTDIRGLITWGPLQLEVFTYLFNTDLETCLKMTNVGQKSLSSIALGNSV